LNSSEKESANQVCAFSISAARVGGWLGLACGASVVSLLELFFFLGYLVKLIMKKFKRRQGKRQASYEG
jgi:hypothetical protein